MKSSNEVNRSVYENETIQFIVGSDGAAWSRWLPMLAFEATQRGSVFLVLIACRPNLRPKTEVRARCVPHLRE